MILGKGADTQILILCHIMIVGLNFCLPNQKSLADETLYRFGAIRPVVGYCWVELLSVAVGFLASCCWIFVVVGWC